MADDGIPQSAGEWVWLSTAVEREVAKAPGREFALRRLGKLSYRYRDKNDVQHENDLGDRWPQEAEVNEVECSAFCRMLPNRPRHSPGDDGTVVGPIRMYRIEVFVPYPQGSMQKPVPAPPVMLDPFRSGAPGRPTAMELIEMEGKRRIKAGEVIPSPRGLSKFAGDLHDWWTEERKKFDPPGPEAGHRAIADRMRDYWRSCIGNNYGNNYRT